MSDRKGASGERQLVLRALDLDRHLTSSLRTAPTPFRLTLLCRLNYSPSSPIPSFDITSTLQLKLNGLHPHPSFSSSASRLSPAATISSGLRKQLSPAFLLCRPSQGMRIRSSNLVIHVASRREFLLRCRAVGIPSNSRLCNSYCSAVDPCSPSPSSLAMVL